VTVEVDVPGDVPLVRADPTHLGQALQELIVQRDRGDGAGWPDHDRRGSLGQRTRGVRIDVTDTGPAYPPRCDSGSSSSS